MPEGLQKKIGPLPLWVWALIVGGVIGGVILLRRGSDTGTAGGVDVGTDTAPFIDPTTGLPYSGEGGSGSLTGTGGAPTMADQIAGYSQAITALKDAGLWPDVATEGASVNAPPTLIALAPGARYYDPLTGETVDGPESIAAKSATPGTTTPGKKPSALDRALTAVQKGSVGPINRSRLKKAGYTNAQIDFHAKRKTPLGQPGKKATPKDKTSAKKPKSKPKVTAAATHPLQHSTAAAPNHAKPDYQSARGHDSHGNAGTWHTYTNGRRVFVRG